MAWPGCRFPGRYRKPRYRGFLQIRLPEVLDHFSFSVPPQVRTSITGPTAGRWYLRGPRWAPGSFNENTEGL